MQSQGFLQCAGALFQIPGGQQGNAQVGQRKRGFRVIAEQFPPDGHGLAVQVHAPPQLPLFLA